MTEAPVIAQTTIQPSGWVARTAVWYGFLPQTGLASLTGDLFSVLGIRHWSDIEGFAKSLAVSAIRAFSQPVRPSWTLIGAYP